MITSQNLKQHIAEEIEFNDFNNWHGIDKENIEKHLIGPIKIDIVTAWNQTTKQYWLVLDELPEDKIDGYQIIFDEEENMFGLATKTGLHNKNIGQMIGLYGSFMNTLNGM